MAGAAWGTEGAAAGTSFGGAAAGTGFGGATAGTDFGGSAAGTGFGAVAAGTGLGGAAAGTGLGGSGTGTGLSPNRPFCLNISINRSGDKAMTSSEEIPTAKKEKSRQLPLACSPLLRVHFNARY